MGDTANITVLAGDFHGTAGPVRPPSPFLILDVVVPRVRAGE